MAFLQCGTQGLDLSRVQVMGVLNVTPDSFSDGGRYYEAGRLQLDKALRQVESMLTAGAAIIDVGGESTRPGAEPVSEIEEQQRVLPLVEAINREFSTIVSVDTSTPSVMREAAALGAGMINDVRALQRDGALAAALASGLPVCLMHMQGEPHSMQQDPQYDDVVGEVAAFLHARRRACTDAGIDSGKIVLDPGFGFGKSLQHNLKLLEQLERLATLGSPLLVGLSRKSMIGRILGAEHDDRLSGSLALAVLAVERGANIIRVHDVQQTIAAVRVTEAVLGER